MKKIAVILFLFSFIFSYESYLSFYGSGEKSSNLSPSNISLGWSNLFTSNGYLNIGSLSTFYSSDLVRLSMSTDFNFNFINTNQYYSQKINYFSVLLPIQNKKSSFGFSLSPFYRINSKIIESEFNYITDGIDPLAYKSEYSFTGGPSIFSILFSSKLNDNMSFGLKLNYIFGSLYSYTEHTIYDIDYNIDGDYFYTQNSIDAYTIIKNYDGYGLEFEGSFKNLKNRLAASFNVANHIKVNQYFYDDIIPETLELGVDYDEKTNYSISSPLEMNIGFSRLIKNKHSFIMEYYFYKPYKTDFDLNILDNSDLSKYRLSLGYYRNILDDKVSISSGLYYIKSYSDIIESNKQGITFGLGINTIEYISIDFCLEIGKNTVEISELLNENYINLYMGLSTSDKWFK